MLLLLYALKVLNPAHLKWKCICCQLLIVLEGSEFSLEHLSYEYW